MEHVAIQREEYTFDDLENLRVLCRCSKRKDVSYNRVSDGDVVYLCSDGLIRSRSTAFDVQCVVSTPMSMTSGIWSRGRASTRVIATGELWVTGVTPPLSG